MAIYTPTPVAITPFTIPADGEDVTAASVNVAFGALGDACAASSPRRDTRTVACSFTVPAGTTRVRATLRAPGGGGGGGAKGADTAGTAPTTGGAGGGAGEVRTEDLVVTPGQVIVFAPGTAGIAGVGAGGAGDGGTGGDATNATLKIGGTTILECFGGMGGGGGARGASAGILAASIGGHSTDRPNGTIARTIPQTTVTAAEGAALKAFAYLFLGPGAGTTTAAYAAAHLTPLAWPTRDGLSATNGANGAVAGAQPGGGGGGGGGCALVVGGAGGAGGAANAGGTGVAGSVGAAPAAASGAGGGGGGSGGCGNPTGGAGANGAAGATGYVIYEYDGPAAVIV